MATYVDFFPSQTSVFSFSPTLDGVSYSATVTWNAFGNRYYLNIFDSFGARILTIPLISSPASYDINLVDGYFTASKLVYRGANNRFEITP